MKRQKIEQILKAHSEYLLTAGAGGALANLTGADLTEADLTRANLSEAYLSEADLTGAYLSEADLTRANLSGADLTGADLTGAYLSEADLTGADLTGADLSRANLSRANLSRADLTGVGILYLKIDEYDIYIRPDLITIGCTTKSLESWRSRTAEEILSLHDNGEDSTVLKRWYMWFPIIEKMAETLQGSLNNNKGEQDV